MWIIVYLISGIISSIVLYYMSVNSPIGYEDDDGFHYGTEKVVDTIE